VARANASEYGLGASVWSADAEKALAIGQQLQAGTIWINETQHLSPLASFAGHKQSGSGIENGLDGLLEYTAAQTITVKKAAAA
jgi:aldehyde dehydrogenase (NAD+)